MAHIMFDCDTPGSMSWPINRDTLLHGDALIANTTASERMDVITMEATSVTL